MKNQALLFFIFFIFISCAKKENSTVNHSYHEDNFPKAYINSSLRPLCFKLDSYWIYQDSASHYLDCTYITRTKFGFYDVYYGLGNFALTEYHSMFFSGHPVNINSDFTLWIENDHMILNPYFVNTCALGKAIFTAGNFYPDSAHIDSLMVGDTVFYKVQVCPVGDTDYYTTANYGVIRKKIHTPLGDQTRNLIRWHIIK